jgi:integrase
MAGITPAFRARQLGHFLEMLLRTYAKWIDGRQNALEVNRLEASITTDLSPIYPKKGR